jgi:outer membrane lipoprotein SlyB
MSKQSLATGIWNSVKQNATDPWVYGGATIGAGIGVYEANTVPNIEGSPIELGAIGMISGAAIGRGLKSLWNTPEGVPFFGRDYA